MPSIIIFAGDHGVAGGRREYWPRAVTQQMVLNLGGGAAINCFLCGEQHRYYGGGYWDFVTR
ncbi:nicotinate-nucleotide--dimethylbenzimidazole phosphoribosyltransferase [Vibrio lentus]|nr:nicotinate-nucleotide--dimethylbenzimidazole phosphoribosyltransferase [Vibrio lentus]